MVEERPGAFHRQGRHMEEQPSGEEEEEEEGHMPDHREEQPVE